MEANMDAVPYKYMGTCKKLQLNLLEYFKIGDTYINLDTDNFLISMCSTNMGKSCSKHVTVLCLS